MIEQWQEIQNQSTIQFVAAAAARTTAATASEERKTDKMHEDEKQASKQEKGQIIVLWSAQPSSFSLSSEIKLLRCCPRRSQGKEKIVKVMAARGRRWYI